MSMTIQLSEQSERRLREEAARRNAPPEELAAKLLNDQLRFPIPVEFDISDEEGQFFVDAVHQFRDEQKSK